MNAVGRGCETALHIVASILNPIDMATVGAGRNVVGSSEVYTFEDTFKDCGYCTKLGVCYRSYPCQKKSLDDSVRRSAKVILPRNT